MKLKKIMKFPGAKFLSCLSCIFAHALLAEVAAPAPKPAAAEPKAQEAPVPFRMRPPLVEAPTNFGPEVFSIQSPGHPQMQGPLRPAAGPPPMTPEQAAKHAADEATYAQVQKCALLAQTFKTKLHEKHLKPAIENAKGDPNDTRDTEKVAAAEKLLMSLGVTDKTLYTQAGLMEESANFFPEAKEEIYQRRTQDAVRSHLTNFKSCLDKAYKKVEKEYSDLDNSFVEDPVLKDLFYEKWQNDKSLKTSPDLFSYYHEKLEFYEVLCNLANFPRFIQTGIPKLGYQAMVATWKQEHFGIDAKDVNIKEVAAMGGAVKDSTRLRFELASRQVSGNKFQVDKGQQGIRVAECTSEECVQILRNNFRAIQANQPEAFNALVDRMKELEKERDDLFAPAKNNPWVEDFNILSDFAKKHGTSLSFDEKTGDFAFEDKFFREAFPNLMTEFDQEQDPVKKKKLEADAVDVLAALSHFYDDERVDFLLKHLNKKLVVAYTDPNDFSKVETRIVPRSTPVQVVDVEKMKDEEKAKLLEAYAYGGIRKVADGVPLLPTSDKFNEPHGSQPLLASTSFRDTQQEAYEGFHELYKINSAKLDEMLKAQKALIRKQWDIDDKDLNEENISRLLTENAEQKEKYTHEKMIDYAKRSIESIKANPYGPKKGDIRSYEKAIETWEKQAAHFNQINPKKVPQLKEDEANLVRYLGLLIQQKSMERDLHANEELYMAKGRNLAVRFGDQVITPVQGQDYARYGEVKPFIKPADCGQYAVINYNHKGKYNYTNALEGKEGQMKYSLTDSADWKELYNKNAAFKLVLGLGDIGSQVFTGDITDMSKNYLNAMADNSDRARVASLDFSTFFGVPNYSEAQVALGLPHSQESLQVNENMRAINDLAASSGDDLVENAKMARNFLITLPVGMGVGTANRFIANYLALAKAAKVATEAAEAAALAGKASEAAVLTKRAMALKAIKDVPLFITRVGPKSAAAATTAPSMVGSALGDSINTTKMMFGFGMGTNTASNLMDSNVKWGSTDNPNGISWLQWIPDKLTHGVDQSVVGAFDPVMQAIGVGVHLPSQYASATLKKTMVAKGFSKFKTGVASTYVSQAGWDAWGFYHYLKARGEANKMDLDLQNLINTFEKDKQEVSGGFVKSESGALLFEPAKATTRVQETLKKIDTLRSSAKATRTRSFTSLAFGMGFNGLTSVSGGLHARKALPESQRQALTELGYKTNKAGLSAKPPVDFTNDSQFQEFLDGKAQEKAKELAGETYKAFQLLLEGKIKEKEYYDRVNSIDGELNLTLATISIANGQKIVPGAAVPPRRGVGGNPPPPPVPQPAQPLQHPFPPIGPNESFRTQATDYTGPKNGPPTCGNGTTFTF
jgi:hypothetical protein